MERLPSIVLAIVVLLTGYVRAQVTAAGVEEFQTSGDQGGGATVPSWVQSRIARILSPPTGALLPDTFATVQYELTNPRLSASSPNFQIQLDNRDPVTTNFTSYTFTGLTPGPHIVRVQVVDANGTAIVAARCQTAFIVIALAEIPGAAISGQNVSRAESDTHQPIALSLNEQVKVAASPPPSPQAPPLVKLRFVGFAGAGQPTKAFLSEGDDVFVVEVGEIVNRRYKVAKINPNSIEMEDTLSNRRQMLPFVTD